jgi:hypothetical protein
MIRFIQSKFELEQCWRYAVYFFYLSMRATREQANIYTDNRFYMAGCSWGSIFNFYVKQIK